MGAEQSSTFDENNVQIIDPPREALKLITTYRQCRFKEIIESKDIHSEILNEKERLSLHEFDEIFGHIVGDPDEHFPIFAKDSPKILGHPSINPLQVFVSIAIMCKEEPKAKYSFVYHLFADKRNLMNRDKLETLINFVSLGMHRLLGLDHVRTEDIEDLLDELYSSPVKRKHITHADFFGWCHDNSQVQRYLAQIPDLHKNPQVKEKSRNYWKKLKEAKFKQTQTCLEKNLFVDRALVRTRDMASRERRRNAAIPDDAAMDAIQALSTASSIPVQAFPLRNSGKESEERQRWDNSLISGCQGRTTISFYSACQALSMANQLLTYDPFAPFMSCRPPLWHLTLDMCSRGSWFEDFPTLDGNVTALQALKKFQKEKVKCMPVYDSTGTLEGILDLRMMLLYFLDLIPEEKDGIDWNQVRSVILQSAMERVKKEISHLGAAFVKNGRDFCLTPISKILEHCGETDEAVMRLIPTSYIYSLLLEFAKGRRSAALFEKNFLNEVFHVFEVGELALCLTENSTVLDGLDKKALANCGILRKPTVMNINSSVVEAFRLLASREADSILLVNEKGEIVANFGDEKLFTLILGCEDQNSQSSIPSLGRSFDSIRTKERLEDEDSISHQRFSNLMKPLSEFLGLNKESPQMIELLCFEPERRITRCRLSIRDSVAQAIKYMAEEGSSRQYITNSSGKPIAVITMIDIIWKILKQDQEKEEASAKIENRHIEKNLNSFKLCS